MPSRPSRSAVLFDLDGTLLDSLGDLAESMNAVLSERGLPTHEVDAFRYFIGDGILELVKRSLPEELRDDEDSLHSFLEAYRASYEARWHLSQPFDGIPEMLDALQERAIGLAVVSNSDSAEACLRATGLRDFFDTVVDGTQVTRRKPHPEPWLTATDRLGVRPEACVAVEDSRGGAASAREAGAFVVGVGPSLAPGDADALFPDVASIPIRRWLKELPLPPELEGTP